MNKSYLMKLFIFFLLFITISKFSFAEIRINEVQNDIYLLDIYGNRSILSKDYQIKTGDYLSTKKKPAIIVLNDNTKICFSTESSVKISKINFLKNNNKIHLEFKKGSVIIFNANLWHGGGANTDGSSRWAITLGYARWFVKPAFDYMQNTPIEIYENLTHERRKLLGLDLAAPKDEFTRVRSRAESPEKPQTYTLPN